MFVPASDERKLAKVGAYGADLIVIDLEDAVAEDQKTAARAQAHAALATFPAGRVVAVRVNGIETGRLDDDIEAVTAPGLAAVVVPKLEDAGTLPAVDAALARAEREAGLAEGTVRVLALIETPLGVVRCEELLAAAPPRTVTAIFGLVDFSVALGVDLTAGGEELAYARGRIVIAARAAGLSAPVDGPYPDLDDLDGLLASSRHVRTLGFQGRVALHPAQLPAINRAFSELGAGEAAHAERVVAAFEEARARGVASLRVGGQFVDYPVYELARRKLSRLAALEPPAAPGD